MCCSRPSPLDTLDTLDTTFHLLAGGPQPLALEGRIIGLQRESTCCRASWGRLTAPAAAMSWTPGAGGAGPGRPAQG